MKDDKQKYKKKQKKKIRNKETVIHRKEGRKEI